MFIINQIDVVLIGSRSCLQNASNRPVSSLENKRIMGVHVIERYIMPVVLVSLMVDHIHISHNAF